MRTLIRSTATLDEYWCNAEKRVIALPKGTTPSFEVTEKPVTMLGEGKAKQEPTNTEGEKFIEDMNAKELRAYAAENDITIPFEIKKTDDIRKFILEHEAQQDAEGDDE